MQEGPGVADPQAWLAAYLTRRAGLAAQDSEFVCDAACRRPGCTHPELLIPVSLLDLLGTAAYRREPPLSVYEQYYTLGLLPHPQEDWVRTPALRLRKPCPFFRDDLCGLYPVRPLPCMLFPEYLVVAGTFQEHAAREHFRDYLCLHRPLSLSPTRRRVMTELMRMWERELLVSSLYLFGQAPCYLDITDLVKVLRAKASSAPAGEDAPGRGVITHQLLEDFFREELAAEAPFATIRDKIRRLQEDRTLSEFLGLLHDDQVYYTLKSRGDDRVAVFRWRRGALRLSRRRLGSGAVGIY